jgi:hypothetical protein
MSRFMKAPMFGILALSCLVMYSAVRADEVIQVPRAKYFFSPAAAPSGKVFAVNASEQAPEGELTSGFLTLVGMDHTPILTKRLSTSESQDTDTPPKWTSNGSKLLFVTTTGIHTMSNKTLETRILRKGSFEGLAISPDDSKLAFWNLAPSKEHDYTLVVIDLASNTEVRSWTMPNNYDADQYGFEIAFAADSRSLFARTYDTEGRTPLKKFELISGQVTVVSENCSGLASSKDAIYFIESGDQGPVLRTIRGGDSQPTVAAQVFPYDDLMTSGTGRWLVARELRTRKLALVDSTNNSVHAVAGRCDSLTVLANDEIVYFKGGVIGTSASVCSAAHKH